MSQDSPQVWENTIDTPNIFDEFSQNQKIVQEVKQIEQKQERDMFFYLKKINTVLLSFNVLLFLAIFLASLYIYFQTQTEKKEYTLLSPICHFLLWDMNITGNVCYGVLPILEEYKVQLAREQTAQNEQIIPLLGEVYSIRNFNFSKKVDFLLGKNEQRLRPLEILTEFDALKLKFASEDKQDVKCYNITISEDGAMRLSCDVLSSDWDSQIVNLNEGVISFLPSGWTSISRASGFIHFLENAPWSPFSVLEKPKTLTSTIETTQVPYTRKTSIDLTLEYNKLENLSF